jgi:hypothetical protein
VQSAVCKKTITNMAGVQNFEVISIKFNGGGIFAYVISRSKYQKKNSNNDDGMLGELEVCTVGKQVL